MDNTTQKVEFKIVHDESPAFAKVENILSDYIEKPTAQRYKSEYCKRLINHMSRGLSYETFGPSIGVAEETLRGWEKKHPDFLGAKRIAFGLCQTFWEEMGIKGSRGKIKNFNSGAWIYNMKTRFRNSKTFGEDQEDKNFTITILGPDEDTVISAR